VGPRPFAISDPPEPFFTAILSASAADLLALRCGLLDLDFQLTRPVAIFCPPRLVLLHIEFNQAILNLGDERALCGCGHGDPPHMGMFKIRTATRRTSFQLGYLRLIARSPSALEREQLPV
jgi:hypothetical protein